MELSEKSYCVTCKKLAQQKTACKSLVSKFSHEIRNPLTLVNSSLQLLEKEYPDLQASALWPQIKQDLNDILALLKDVSSLNNIDTMHRSSFTAGSFVTEIKNSFTSLMKEREIGFLVSCDYNAEAIPLFADKYKLREAIVNLLLNAADAVSSQKEAKAVSLFCTADETDVCFHVKDNGAGIPSEYMETLFDPFVTHKVHGTGLGLGIAKSIARQHGGSLTLDTCSCEPDTYTHFCVRLPLKANKKA